MLSRVKWIAIAGCLASLLRAAEPGGVANPKEPTTQTDADWIDDRWTRTEIGPFLHATVEMPGRRTPKAISIKVGDASQATVCFDTDTLRYVAGWTGGFLKLHPQRYGLIAAPTPDGEVRFASKPGPGWAPPTREEQSFRDPRTRGLGPLPRDWAHFKGLYLSGNRVVLKYTVGELEILDSPWFEELDGRPVFTRSLEISGKGVLSLLVGDVRNARVSLRSENATVEDYRTTDGNIAVRIGGDANRRRVRIGIGGDSKGGWEDLAAFTSGGPARWGEPLRTKGVRGPDNGPFAIDTLSVPYANPWNALMFTSGHDFLPSGEAVVSTIHGDVWLVSGIGRELGDLAWKRFATGLYQPLGVKVRDGRIFVIERDQITVLHDLNGDYEADFYENFNNDCISAGGGHSYATSLETDSQGNFYFTKCAENTPHGGSVLRVSADGAKLEVIATGFRNPNGLGIGPGDLVTVADQQGDWVPETRLDLIKRGGFYGFMPMHKRATAPTSFDPPLCWVPRAIDNSAGGQAWVPEGRWGQLDGKMLHLSYGRCSMMLILVDGLNGGIVPLPGRFLSGVMRGRFHGDALYLTGLRGWQTAAIRDGCFQRVRRTEAPFLAPVGFKVRSEGLELAFDVEVDPELARDPANYSVEQWNYKWSERYGSADYSLRNPGREGRDKLVVETVALAGSRTILLKFREPLQPVNTMRVNYSLESSEGVEMRGEFFCTINSP